jgi:hypothetical protein
MKKLLLISCFLLLSCASKKTNPEIAMLNGECPKSAECKIELLKNKSMVVKSDAFGGTFYELEDNTMKSVVKYTYSKIVKGNVQDAGYREEIVFEINNGSYNLTQSGEALQNTKMLFGRFCFCRGQTGYYKVHNGNLSITGSKEKSVFLNFQVDAVPQITNAISFFLK